ncbi:hypothetical protein [Burkholderia savannae]|uniref:hypothetical protein n=1 Tax=Burkholderia savannae TaxID=1637837 RepID=UPI000B090C2B|nr:hypothetical protein [Burkholderia savannae]
MFVLTKNAWWHEENEALGIMNAVSRSISRLELAQAGVIPNVRNDPTLLVGSDFGGTHRKSPYETIGILLAGSESIEPWSLRQMMFREKFLPDGRRVSYKGLNDRTKFEALPRFLDIANSINGILLIILIDKRLGSIFSENSHAAHTDIEPSFLRSWSPPTIERMLRITWFTGILLRGLSVSGQNLLWFIDQDDIAANEKRHRELVECFKLVSSHCLQHQLGHCRIGTTASDNGNRQVEDLAALPDLALGAWGDVLPRMVADGLLSNTRLSFPPPSDLKPKTRRILDWFSDNSQPLRRATIILDSSPTSKKCRISSVIMHGTRDFTPPNNPSIKISS